MRPRPHGAYADGAGIRAVAVVLEGNLAIPRGARGMVLFAHGSGSGRFSPRNRRVAANLNDSGIATLLVDLLTEEEEAVDSVTAPMIASVAHAAEVDAIAIATHSRGGVARLVPGSVSRPEPCHWPPCQS
jgi:hypothetical protein